MAPADAPEYSFICFREGSIVLRYPSIENIPMAPGPTTRYSNISSFNNTEEIAFSKERTQVRRRSYEQPPKMYWFDPK